MKVTPASPFAERTFTGTAKAADQVNLSFRVGGPLVDLPVAVGDSLNRGQILARIDPRDYETALATVTSELAAAKSQLEAASSARPEDLRKLEAGVGAARAQVAKAEADYERVERLFINDNAPRTDLDATRAARDVARANLSNAEESLSIGQRGARKEDIATMEAKIGSLEAAQRRAQDALNDTRLRAPFSGVVSEKYVENFEDVLPKQRIVRLLDVTRIEMVISIPENMIPYIGQVQEVECRFESVPDRAIPARISEVGQEASEATRTYPVTLVLDQKETAGILPGMSGEARFLGAREDVGAGTIIIPASAVLAGDSGTSLVWTIDEDSEKVARRQIEVQAVSSDGVVVQSGLQPGEWIATAGVHFLREGQQVRIIDVGGVR
jgi:RND family efflux transporter MFP subunit